MRNSNHGLQTFRNFFLEFACVNGFYSVNGSIFHTNAVLAANSNTFVLDKWNFNPSWWIFIKYQNHTCKQTALFLMNEI